MCYEQTGQAIAVASIRAKSKGLQLMKTVFVPVTLAEAEYAIAKSGLTDLGVELIPIPAMGGCVIAVREVAQMEKPKAGFWNFRWLDQVTHLRVEQQVNSFLQTLAIPNPSRDGHPIEARIPR